MSTVFRSPQAPSRPNKSVRKVVLVDSIAPSSYFRWQGAVNRLLGTILLVLAAPIILLGLCAVVLTSPGAPLYRQRRVGKNGRIFSIYKIRSMRVDAEARTGAVWTTSSRDPRITPVGRVLRATHIDELPQLFNVVKGEMALVGPRPERPEFTEHLGEVIPGYLDRLKVLPGLTGLAQLNLPPDCDLESVRRKLVLDLEYVRCGSLRLDLVLIGCTALKMACIPSKLLLRLTGIHRNPRGGELCAVEGSMTLSTD